MDSKNVGTSSSPALYDGILYVGNDGLNNIHFYAIDPSNGAVKWKWKSPKQIFSSPAVVDGIVYFHVRDDHVYALRTEDGSMVWKTPAPSPQRWFPVFQDPSKSSPAIAGERLFVGIGKNLVALDRMTGREIWKTPTGRKVDSTPLVVGKTIYVGSDDKHFYAFDSDTGRKVWSFKTGGRVSSSPTYGEGLILIGSNDGILYAFEGTGGLELSSVDSGSESIRARE